MAAALSELEIRLGYEFRDRALLVRALTHSSWLAERKPSEAGTGDNEQLEFLGDSILGFVVSEWLLNRNASAPEGRLSQSKAQIVSSAHLHQCAAALGLGDHLLLGKGEDRSGGRERKTLLANALEAIIAAVHLDGGIDAARLVIESHILEFVDDEQVLEPKSLAQEKAQKLGLPLPRYSTIQTSGPEHAKVFTVQASVGDRFITTGQGSSKKLASQRAAELLVAELARCPADAGKRTA